MYPAKVYAICTPQPLRLWEPHVTTPATMSDKTTVYQVREVTYCGEGVPVRVRVGWSGGLQPAERDLLEHVPTALAGEGLLDWDEVSTTERDRREPVAIEEYGDPLKPCDPRLPSLHGMWGVEAKIDASCACGWRTERLALDRRSQLVRAVRRHALGEAARRERFHQPIKVVFEGLGPQVDCYGGVAVDERMNTIGQRILGRCRRCRWETESVELFRIGPLSALCQAHTGPDGVRRVRDQLIAALGLPPADEHTVRFEREAGL